MARILIIEDHPVNMNLACMMMENAGHEALRAVDAEIGLTMVVSERIDLILMDIQLPGMDGLAATRLLKQNPSTASIPIIAVTALAKDDDRKMAFAAGCNAYIAKPIRYKKLLLAIDGLLQNGELVIA